MTQKFYRPAVDIITEWGLVGPSDHANAVLANNGDSSYVFRTYAQTGWDVWSGAFDSMPEEGAPNYVVFTFAVGRATNTGGTGGNQAKAVIRIGGVDYDLGTMTFATTFYLARTVTWNVNPATGLAWTPEDFATIEAIGLRKTASLLSPGQIRITESYLRVDYTLETKQSLRGVLVAKSVGRSVFKVGPAGSARSTSPVGRLRVL